MDRERYHQLGFQHWFSQWGEKEGPWSVRVLVPKFQSTEVSKPLRASHRHPFMPTR